MHRPFVVLFWLFWVLEVNCVVDDEGDVTCLLETRNGTNIICREGGEESKTVKKRGIKPEMDAECMTPLLRW